MTTRAHGGLRAVPSGYRPTLGLRRREEAIKFIKDSFERRLATALNLSRASAPVAVASATGLNDHLNGVERPASFTVKALGCKAEIVQSLAKWKRAALADYGMRPGEGLYTDMNAVRPDDVLDNLHSVYVDQWDWERVITACDRTVAFLRAIVRRIYATIRAVERRTCARFPSVGHPFLPPRITFVHSEQLALMYPGLTPRQREQAVCREAGAVFVVGIGAPLFGEEPHDGRAADYDDWSTVSELGRPGLNGDLLVWYPVLGCAMELSSMGIRVDPAALRRQLALRGRESEARLPFHRRLLAGRLPLTIGGGIGQSRLCMLFLRCAHIGEVQAGIWPESLRKACRKKGMVLL